MAGGGPIWLYIPMIIIWGIGGNVVVINYAKKLCGLSVLSYIKGVVIPVLGVTVSMLIFGYIPFAFVEQGYFRFFLCGICTTLGIVAAIFSYGATASEREIVLAPIYKLLHKK